MAIFRSHPLVKALTEVELQWSVDEHQAELRANTLVCFLISIKIVEGEIYNGRAIESGSLKE